MLAGASVVYREGRADYRFDLAISLLRDMGETIFAGEDTTSSDTANLKMLTTLIQLLLVDEREPKKRVVNFCLERQ